MENPEEVARPHYLDMNYSDFLYAKRAEGESYEEYKKRLKALKSYKKTLKEGVKY
jgi:hypothetical protein